FVPGDAPGLAGALTRLVREPGLVTALRAGIPAVRRLEDDVAAARHRYQSHAANEPSRTAAVVLNFGTPDETYLAVRSLLASRRPLSAVIVVNNDGDDSDCAMRAALKPVWPRVTYVHTGRNRGFSGRMNAGIRDALARG